MKKIALFKLLFSVLCIAAISFVSCDRIRSYESPPPNSEQPAEDEVEPTYTTPDQLAFLQASMIDAEYINRAFMDMPGDVLYNVASVCINKFNGATTKKQVVIEYENNREIYDNLKSPTDSMNTETTSQNITTNNAPTAGTTGPPGDTQLSRTEGDTIIGGTLYRKISYQYEKQ